MIGMSQIKKKFFTGIGIGGGVGILGIIIVSVISISTINSYKEGTNEKYNSKYMSSVSVLNQDVIQGQTITSDMITKKEMHISMIPEDISTNPVGSIAKFNLLEGMSITDNMLTGDIISLDTRRTEINSVLLPSDMLFEGEFVDIRINFASGTDYIVLVGKEVKSINGSTIWLDLTELEIQLLNSAIVDSYLNEGTKLYATKYVDASMQINYQTQEETEKEGSNYISAEEKEIKQIIYDLIKTELPELNIEDEQLVTEEDFNKEESSEEGSVNEGSSQEQGSADNSTAVKKVYEFIQKYNGLVPIITSTKRTYEPNMQVRDAISTNPNITKVAQDYLSSDKARDNRQNIENRNATYFTQNSDLMSNVVSGAEDSITEQEELRNSLLIN